MGRKSYKFQKKGTARFSTLIHAIVRHSDAWKACDSKARDVYIGLLIRYNGMNNGYIGFSCRDAAEYANCSKNSAANAFKKLIEVGLIKCVTESNFDCRKKLAREWALTHEPIDGTPATSEWKMYKLKASPKRRGYSPITGTDYLKEVI